MLKCTFLYSNQNADSHRMFYKSRKSIPRLKRSRRSYHILFQLGLHFSKVPAKRSSLYCTNRPIFCLIFGEIFGKISEICKIQFIGVLSCVHDQYTPYTQPLRKFLSFLRPPLHLNALSPLPLPLTIHQGP